MHGAQSAPVDVLSFLQVPKKRTVQKYLAAASYPHGQ
jgi:hypothetical protein